MAATRIADKCWLHHKKPCKGANPQVAEYWNASISIEKIFQLLHNQMKHDTGSQKI